MSNSKRGGVSFNSEAGNFVLRYNTNALCRIEDETGKPVSEILETMQDAPSIKMMRTIFGAGLSPAQSPEDVGDLIDELTFAEVSNLVERAFKLAFPEGEQGEGKPKATGKA